jgi:choline dehydrogenase-like flavoprotein
VLDLGRVRPSRRQIADEGARGLYVTDASAFPNAAGVNPMLTVMALARRTASRMVAGS